MNDLVALAYGALHAKKSQLVPLNGTVLPATKGMKSSQVISSGASCRSTLSSAWSARANRAVPTGAPHFRPRSAISLRSPRAAARNIGVLEARYSSFEAGYGSRNESIQFSNALRFPSSTRCAYQRRL